MVKHVILFANNNPIKYLLFVNSAQVVLIYCPSAGVMPDQ